MKLNNADIRFMLRAIGLGKSARGKTGDNPYVGCVITKDGAVIGEGATLYSTVEPCSEMYWIGTANPSLTFDG